MRAFLLGKKRQYLFVVGLALVLALLAELLVFVCEPKAVYADDAVSLLNSEDIPTASVGYEIQNGEFTQVEPDPQLIFSNVNRTVESVVVSFAKPIFGKLYAQVYYHEAGSDYSAEKATQQVKVPFGSSHIVLKIPSAQYEGIRVDIDGKFALADVVASPDTAKVVRTFSNPFGAKRFAAMMAVMTAVGCLLVWWVQRPKTATKLSGCELVFVIGCFVFYTLWAISKPITYSPDEQMRFQVTQFLFEHNRLPVGDELISQPWGFSYAHFPTVLCNELGYLFMKVASLFTSGEFKLLIAARMVSVCAGTGVVYFVIKASKLLFRSTARYIMIVFVALMPQFAFLSSYVNNDSLALFGVAMILYAWTLAITYNWEWRSALVLALGVATCGLSYYNSYPWILMSIVFFVVSYYYQNRKDHKGFGKMLAFIVAIVVALIGYSFIRHVVLYGDLLGFQTRHYYGELYGIQELKPSVTQSLSERGVPFMTMLFDAPYDFLERTWESFVGVFSYLSVFCSQKVYDAVLALVIAAAAGLVLKTGKGIARKARPDWMRVLMVVCMIISGAIAIGLAVRMSYTGDFQPQGRYCYPAFLTIAFLVAKGLEALIVLLKRREHQYAVTAMVCTAFTLMSYYVYTSVFLPS